MNLSNGQISSFAWSLAIGIELGEDSKARVIKYKCGMSRMNIDQCKKN